MILFHTFKGKSLQPHASIYTVHEVVKVVDNISELNVPTLSIFTSHWHGGTSAHLCKCVSLSPPVKLEEENKVR
jgi:hypothetical protein